MKNVEFRNLFFFILNSKFSFFFDLPLPPFLLAQAQHQPLIDTDRFHPSSATPKKLCTLLLNLDFPGRTICTESAQDLVLRKAKIPQIVTNTGTRYTGYYIYQISYLAVKKKNGIF